MLTLSQLTNEVSEDEALASIISILAAIGLQSTSWQSGSIQLTFIQLLARVYSRATTTVAQIAGGGFLGLGTSDYLTLLAKYVFDLDRVLAQQTIGKFTLTSSVAAPTHTWAAGDIIVADQPSGSENANTYRIVSSGTLNPNNTQSVDFVADKPGSAANIAPNTTLYFWTPLVGVTVSNPALVPTSTTWITTPGSDRENDDRLIARCLGRWARLTYANTDGAYRAWALEALPALTRVAIANAAGDGTVKIIGATALGPLTSPQCDTIVDYIYGVNDGVGRRPLNDIVTAEPSVNVTTPALNYTLYVRADVRDTIEADVYAAVMAYVGGVPIGGTKLLGIGGKVLAGALWDAANSTPGVVNATLDVVTDIPLAYNETYAPTINFTTYVVAPGVA